MARTETEDFQLYFSRIRPIYHQLFNLAHTITGNADRAEYCLQCAMLDCWSSGDSGGSRHGFRESLRSSVTRTALRTAAGQEAPEFDWDGLRADAQGGDPLLKAIAQEGIEMQRLLALRYGCGLSRRRISRLTGWERGRIQTLLNRFEARTRRRLPAGDRRRLELLITRCVRGQLSQPAPRAPEMGRVFRSFQSDAANTTPPNRLPGRILRGVLVAILAILCVLAFWFTAVLMQPPVLEEVSPQAETVTAEEQG